MYGEECLHTPGLSLLGVQTSPTRLLLSHRKLSVFLAVLICLVMAALIVFFLFPRSITVQPAGLNSSTVALDEADIRLNITVGGCLHPWVLTPPSQQYSSVALAQCCDRGHP